MISCAFPQLSIAWQNARWPASAAACATGATGLGSIVEVNVEPLTWLPNNKPQPIYPLVMTNIAMENGPFIDGLPSYKMVIFHGYVK